MKRDLARKIARNILITISFLFLIFVWARFVEPNIVKLEMVSLVIDNFPVNDLRILHLTDFHSRNFGEKERKVLQILEETDPDFIFITGDIVDWQTKDLDSCSKFWRELGDKRESKIFAVYGNHEHRNPRFKKIVKLLAENDIKVLVNESIEIDFSDDSLYLIGLDDPHLGFDDAEKAMEDVPQNGPKIMLAHSPEIFRKIKQKDIGLVLVGHTHGCQINLPIICDWILPLKYDRQYKQGLFEEQGTYMYVNRGIGETFLPFRFNCFPEATLITINP